MVPSNQCRDLSLSDVKGRVFVRQTEGELMKAHSDRMRRRALAQRKQRWMNWAWVSAFVICSASAATLWWQERSASKMPRTDRPAVRPVQHSAGPREAGQQAEVRSVEAKSTPITGRLIATTGSAGYGSEAPPTASRRDGPVVQATATLVAPPASDYSSTSARSAPAVVVYRLVGTSTKPVIAPASEASTPELVPGAVLKAATGLPSLASPMAAPTAPQSAPKQAPSTSAPALLPARRVEPPQQLPAERADSEGGSGVLLNEDPSQVTPPEESRPLKLIAIVNPLTIVVPDGRGIPRSFEVGGRLPNGAMLRSVDPKLGCAITDRGQFCLK